MFNAICVYKVQGYSLFGSDLKKNWSLCTWRVLHYALISCQYINLHSLRGQGTCNRVTRDQKPVTQERKKSAQVLEKWRRIQHSNRWKRFSVIASDDNVTKTFSVPRKILAVNFGWPKFAWSGVFRVEKWNLLTRWGTSRTAAMAASSLADDRGHRNR